MEVSNTLSVEDAVEEVGLNTKFYKIVQQQQEGDDKDLDNDFALPRNSSVNKSTVTISRSDAVSAPTIVTQ